MITVTLSDADYNAAVEYQRRVNRFTDTYAENYTGMSIADRYLLGALGERAVAIIFDTYGITHEAMSNDQGRSDACDFRVKNSVGEWLTIDVKTCSKHTARSLLLNERQANRKKCDLYVGCRARITDVCEIDVFGVVSHDKLTEKLDTSLKWPAYRRNYDDLFPIEAALNYFEDDGRANTQPGATGERLP